MSRTGTSARLKSEIPFVPRHTKNTETASPISDNSGRNLGSSASSPASIPAAGTSEIRQIIPSIAPAPFLKRKRTAAWYPPYRLPRYRNKNTSAENRTDERMTGSKNCSPGKKRTSSAPEMKPAPMLVPTMKNAARSILIGLTYDIFKKNMTNLHKNVRHNTLTIDKNFILLYNSRAMNQGGQHERRI